MKFEGTDLIWYLLLHLWHLSGNFWVGINKRCSEQPWNFWGLESVHSKKSSTDKQVEWEQTLSRDRKKPPPTVCPSCIISHFIPSGAFSDPQDSASPALLRWSGQSVPSWPLDSSEKNTDLISVFQNKWVSTVFSVRISMLVSKFSGLSVGIREF